MRFFFCWICVFSGAALGQMGGALREVHVIGGKRYEVATDEVARKDGAGRMWVEKMERQATAERARQRAVVQQADLVMYEAGQVRSAASRRVVRNQIVVKMKDGVDAKGLAAAMNLKVLRTIQGAPGFVLLETTSSGEALTKTEALLAREEVMVAEPQLARQQSKRLIPNDTFFGQQWHLRNTGQSSGLSGVDANVVSVWDTNKGAGIRIGIVDDGLQTTHPDLSPNVDTVNDYDWNDGTPNDPNPVLSVDFHGTSCAGVAAAKGNNALGVSGAAPDATLVGLRLIGDVTTDAQEAEAMGWKNDIIEIKSNSWGPNDDGVRLEGPGTLTEAALATATTSGRGGRGTVILWAGGNGGTANDNSNYDGYANSLYTIAVGALGNNGRRASYSEQGANLVITAPSNGGTLGVVTTDLVGNNGYNTSTVTGELSNRDYTNDFGGTSSATPLAAGVVALMLKANPNLGWRDVQEILIRSATKVDATDSDWVTNAAGFAFNHKYGAGMINAQAAVTRAATWTNLTAATSRSSAQTGLTVSIPDNNSTGITRTFDLSATNLRVEQVTLTFSALHTSRGQLAVTLTSPSGTVSRLAERHSDTNDHYSAWKFGSVRHWGENSQGQWTLRVSDLASGTTGTLTGATLTVHGVTVGPVNQPPVIGSATLSRSGMVFTDETVSVSGVSASDPESDPITLAYQWQQSSNNVAFTDIAGATTSSLALNGGLSGRLVRCRITPTAATQTGAAFTTETVAVNQRPARLGRVGQAYSHDSDLFLVGNVTTFGRSLILNEFSQGNGASKEWVEMLVLQTSDLRGYTVGDRQGTYATFGSVALWSAVPAGTLIVIYNGLDRDTGLPTTQDLDASDGRMVIAHNNTSAFGSGTWGGLSNSNAESLVVRSNGQVIAALSLNNENVYDPKLAAVGSTRAALYTGNTDTGADAVGEWTIGNASAATPGVGNGGVNTAFVSDLRSGAFSVEPKFRLAASSDVVPGLTLNELTGVFGGSPTVPGLYQVVVERFLDTQSVTHAFPLLVLDSNGNGVIAGGKTWVLDAGVTLPGDLTIQGSVDTAGKNLTVNGTFVLNGSFVNATGTLTYLNRQGALPGGAIRLAVNSANDVADSDGDGMLNLMEFYLGTDPSKAGASPVTMSVVGGYLRMTQILPAGMSGVVGTVEVSDGLQTWQSGAGVTQTVSDSAVGGSRTVVVRDLVPVGRRFMRLRVTR